MLILKTCKEKKHGLNFDVNNALNYLTDHKYVLNIRDKYICGIGLCVTIITYRIYVLARDHLDTIKSGYQW